MNRVPVEKVQAIYNDLVQNARLPAYSGQRLTQKQLAEKHEVAKMVVTKVKTGKHSYFTDGTLEWNALAVLDKNTHRAKAFRQHQVLSARNLLRAGLISKQAYHIALQEIQNEYYELEGLSVYKRNKQAIEKIAKAKEKMQSIEGQLRIAEANKRRKEEQAKKLYCKQIERSSAQIVTNVRAGKLKLEEGKAFLFRKFNKADAESYWASIESVLSEAR